MKLIREIESYFPIPVFLSHDLRQVVRNQGINVSIGTELKITKVFVVSLTHLRIRPGHPLRDKISAYQK